MKFCKNLKKNAKKTLVLNYLSKCQVKCDPDGVVLETMDLPRSTVIIYNKYYYKEECFPIHLARWALMRPGSDGVSEWSMAILQPGKE